MRLFDIDENYQIRPNKAWIAMVPEFAELLRRDKGSKGDSDGRKKLQARKEFTFIYIFVDFGSVIRDWEEPLRYQEALKYADLEAKDIDDAVKAAIEKYRELMFKSSRSLRTLISVKKGLDAMDKYFENVNFTEVSKRTGELVNTPEKFQTNVTRLNKVYDEIYKFEKRVEEDLSNQEGGIRGAGELGDQEGKRKDMFSTWSEADIRKGSEEAREGTTTVLSGRTFDDIRTIVSTSTREVSQEEIDAYKEEDED